MKFGIASAGLSAILGYASPATPQECTDKPINSCTISGEVASESLPSDPSTYINYMIEQVENSKIYAATTLPGTTNHWAFGDLEAIVAETHPLDQETKSFVLRRFFNRYTSQQGHIEVTLSRWKNPRYVTNNSTEAELSADTTDKVPEFKYKAHITVTRNTPFSSSTSPTTVLGISNEPQSDTYTISFYAAAPNNKPEKEKAIPAQIESLKKSVDRLIDLFPRTK